MKLCCHWTWRLACLAGFSIPLMSPNLFAQEKPSDWPQFRGPTGQGASRDRGLPLKWSPKENVVWKTELPGPSASSPIVIGSRVFVTCSSGYGVPWQGARDIDQLKLHLVCLDRDQGKIVWDTKVAAKLPEQAKIRESHGYASGTPAADSERIYVSFGKTDAFAFDYDGKEVWRADIGSQTNGWGTAASPMLLGDLVIVNASVESGALIALDKKTGQEKWRARGMRESWNTPVLVTLESGKTELAVAIFGKVLGLDPASGAQLWSCATDIPWYMVPSMVSHEGVVYCIGGRGGGGSLAVRAGGKGDVTKTHRLWAKRKGSNVSSPIYHDGHLYWMNDVLEIAYCAKADTGEIVYEERLARAGEVYGSPVLADGKLYYFSRQGRAFVLAASPNFEQLAVNDLADRTTFNSSPAVAGGRLLVRSDRYLYCLGLK